MKRGFLFTVLALVLLSFIFISLQLWAQAQTQEEARAAERFRVESLQTALSMVSNDTLQRYANASAIYALQKLATGIEDHPDCTVRGIKYCTNPNACGATGGPYPDGTYYLNVSIYELMANGSTPGYLKTSTGEQQDSPGGWFFYASNPSGLPGHANLTYSGDETKYSFAAFFNRTRAAVRMLGYDVQWTGIENFTLNQTSPWNMTLTMTVGMNFSDPRGLANITRRMNVNLSIPIDGFSDPSILRADFVHRTSNDTCVQACAAGSNFNTTLRPHRNIYVSPAYGNATDAQAKLKAEGVEGLGWFFGPVSEEPRSGFSIISTQYNLSRINTYIYKTSSAADALAESGYFGGLIITTPSGTASASWDETRGGVSCHYTTLTQTNCLNCIFQQSANDSRCPLVPTHVLPETIPYNPNVAYIQTNNINPAVGVPVNYHLNLPELLISNQINFSQFCSPSFDFRNPVCNDLTSQTGLNSKFYSSGSFSKAWDLTGPRDMALCGFYVRSDWGPSYSQRFLDYWTQPNSFNTPYSVLGQGIESFAVGQWSGGATDACAKTSDPKIEQYSRLDYQFYAYDMRSVACTGPFVQGLPGCRSPADCESLGPINYSTGRFATSNPTLTQVGKEDFPTYPARYGTNNLTIFPANVIPLSSVCK
ncbi:Uncharacterised protein [uncultured archaeon]|nr:Uncharacterised protein [uncultured archaeon]